MNNKTLIAIDRPRVTYIGHHSWEVASSLTRLLVNPLLLSDIGNSEGLRPSIWPKRTIDFAALNDVAGVVLTSPHVQSLQIASLEKLSRQTEIYISDTFPPLTAHILRQMGFKVNCVALGREVCIGDLCLAFYGYEDFVASWELSTANLYIWPRECSYGGVLIHSDVPVSRELAKKFCEGALPSPKITIATNNLRLSQYSVDNILDPRKTSSITNFDAICSMALSAQAGYSPPDFLLLSGSGYLPADGRKYLFWDQDLLAKILDRLALRQRVLRLIPGQSLMLDSTWLDPRLSQIPWIISDIQTNSDFSPEEPGYPTAIVTSGDDCTALEGVLANLSLMIPVLLQTAFVRNLGHTRFHLGVELDAERFGLELIGSEATYYVALDIVSGRFGLCKPSSEPGARRWPTGIIAHLHDLHALFEARIQAYEFIRISARQWHQMPSFASSPFGFLLGYFCDAIQPKHSAAVLMKECRRLTGSHLTNRNESRE